MKKLLLISTLAFAFASCHNGNNTTNKDDSAAKIGRQSNFVCPGDSLNLAFTAISPTVAATYTAAAQNDVLVSGQTSYPPTSGQTLPFVVAQIPYHMGDSINKAARGLPKPPGHYISAVEILFGLTVAPGNVFTFPLFFKPLIIPGTLNGTVGTYTCTASDTNGFYTVNSSGVISSVPYSTVSADTANFRQYTYYYPCPSCGTGVQWTYFNTSTNMNGSTRCVIYPMQEIASMFGVNTTGTINLYYICHKYDASDSIKLDLMLNITSDPMTTNNNNDVSHLVPPATTLTYTVIPKADAK